MRKQRHRKITRHRRHRLKRVYRFRSPTSFDEFSSAGARVCCASLPLRGRITNIMTIIRFDARCDDEGWTIYDRATNEPASVEGQATVGLAQEDAEEIADLMNTLALMREQHTVH
jgi:hypothetical protein